MCIFVVLIKWGKIIEMLSVKRVRLVILARKGISIVAGVLAVTVMNAPYLYLAAQ